MFQRRLGAPTRRLTIALILLCSPALAPALAEAGVGAGAAVTFPTTVTVGQTGLPASITMTNFNTPPNSADTNTVCNAGEASPPCSSPERGIVLVPTCKQVAGGQCTAAGADPGVFAVSPTATGAVGSSCAGVVFDIDDHRPGVRHGALHAAPCGRPRDAARASAHVHDRLHVLRR